MPKQKAMVNTPSAAMPARTFARSKKRRSDFDRLADSASFVLLMGALITASGLVCFIAFLNPFSKYLLDVGLILCLYAFAVKILDVGLKIIGVRN